MVKYPNLSSGELPIETSHHPFQRFAHFPFGLHFSLHGSRHQHPYPHAGSNCYIHTHPHGNAPADRNGNTPAPVDPFLAPR
jgi:hypothetical protein